MPAVPSRRIEAIGKWDVDGTRARFGTRRPLATVAAVAIAAAVLAGCSTQSDPVARAQAQVTSKEKAVAEAQAEFDTAAAQFCESTVSYVEALDRYGDVVTDTAPTVGDVRTAGEDLTAPRGDAADSAEAAIDARDALLTAQEELDAARTALAEAMTTSSGAPPTASATAAATPPTVPEASVKRVEEAEADFQAAQESITAETPLTEASERFHSAAVALELAWLRLLLDAGCMTDEQRQAAAAAVSAYVAALQQDLADAGYYSGEIDGIYGPTTTAAVESLQKANGLPVTGTIDEATVAALEKDLAAVNAAAAQGETATTAAVQQTLRLLGFWDGPVDGVWTPELTDAVKKLQSELGVEATGKVDAATIAALEKTLAELQSPTPEPSPTATY